MDYPIERIRNFCIIAHIDHGKSTLADRLLDLTGAVTKRESREQILDAMDLERERGITIKAHNVRLNYRAKDGQDYLLNLIDTPGHVDFTYEVSRSLAACEGALLVVDASQGVEAQTIANAYLALENNVHMIPVINKIDLPGADIPRTREQIEEAVGLDASGAVLISAKEGIGIEEVLEAIVHQVPPPSGSREAPLRALLFDAWFDAYLGAVILVRVFDGTLAPGKSIRLLSTGKDYPVLSVGAFTPKRVELPSLSAGEVGFVVTGIKSVRETRIGDTVANAGNSEVLPYPGFQETKPMVFCGLFPTESDQYEDLKEALDKLRMNDASFTYEMETSLALGFGFRCGFLGLLHMEIPGEEEIRVAWEILKALKLRERGVDIVACPTCGRIQFDMWPVVNELEKRLSSVPETLTVAIMGCAVNGPGEAKDAKIGIAGGKHMGLLYRDGQIVRRVEQDRMVEDVWQEVQDVLREARSGGAAVKGDHASD